MKVFDFINHASFKCEHSGSTLVTDPWYVSNAFGGWYQNPSPLCSNVMDLINSDDKTGVVVSHGHDDHLDDWFIQHHLKKKIFFCPKFPTPGLENRLNKNLGVITKSIGEGERFGKFIIQQFVNPDFTHYDAVVTIETPDFLIIHANDNWHKWPEEMALKIKNVVSRYNINNVYLLIQFGVADSFPVNYENINKVEAKKILNDRFQEYLNGTESNMNALGLSQMYYYANQSLFSYKNIDLDGQSMNELAQLFLKSKKKNYVQLLPGMSVNIGHNVVYPTEDKISIFKYCLNALENFINSAYEKYTNDKSCIKVRFKLPKDPVSINDINYIAESEVWNRIIIGELTLESIIIGGAGSVSKPSQNIRDHHMFVSKRAYMAQGMIQKLGLLFFKEFQNES